MIYNFKDILNTSIYENASVMFVVGKYTIFNNMIGDTLKQMCIDSALHFDDTQNISDEFIPGESSEQIANVVDFNTFFDVVGVTSMFGKWFCRIDLSLLNKKQKDKLNSYIKNPSNNGVLVIVSTEWNIYREYLRNKTLRISQKAHLIQLSFPNRNILKQIVKQMFESKNLEVDASAIELFITKMSRAYDDYEDMLATIADIHKEGPIDKKIMNGYLKGVENYIIDDYVRELVKPLSSGLTNNKKVLRMMITLEDDIGAKNLVYQLLKIIDECIEYRILINNGYIPIGLNYFFKEVINDIPNNEKYANMQEWQFRNKAILASLTSLKDWQYMRMILNKAIENVRMSDDELDRKCQKALYELSTRSVLTEDRLDNIVGFSDIIEDGIDEIDRVLLE